MATALQICRLRVKTAQGWQDPYDLDQPVVAVVGPVDTGKSSLLDCIAFALGRDIDEFRGAVDRELRAVEIVVRVASGVYTLRRSRRTRSYIEILDASGTSEGRFPTRMREGVQTISDWLFQQLGIADLMASVRLPGERRLGFADALFPYCYLTQEDIDRHVIMARREDATRLTTLKLLFNLTSAKAERLAGTMRDVDNELAREKRRLKTIGDFLAGSAATHPDAVDREIERLREAEMVSASNLLKLRAKARSDSPDADPTRERVFSARRRVSDAEHALDGAIRKRRAVEDRMEPVKNSLEELAELEHRSPDCRSTLRIAFRECPACEADITDRITSPGHCHLCIQRLPGADHQMERERLTLAYQRLEAEFDKLYEEERRARLEADAARRELEVLLDSLNLQAGEIVAPHVDSIAAAAGELSRIRASVAALTRVQDAHRRLREQYDQISGKQKEQEERRRRNVGSADLERLEDVLSAINGIFESIVKGIELPNATGQARLDPESLLPLVDEQAFTRRGGGARAAVSIAYSLSLLTYTLENGLARLPALLMIDSPQKNFGANKDDKALAHRVYERFLDYMGERSSWRQVGLRRPFQVIIVDNDLHADIRKRITVHQFTRDEGFIRGLTNPHGSPAIRQLAIDDVDR
ncbi:AAA family ATPase [Solwaraspora sp. WMMD1047]|uniref:AAA family ATPase n=1 Tax=Solwaraspora sp. WMMD1047 TaxID=3016102 RepID=UPI0024166095|nr:AAA family ATPase [Solwaraspora sp. WMMD1047]MDG4833992.1 AAA family ATPase [Solwaraspora sp. WMMD1047]